MNANRPMAFVADEALLDDLLKLAVAAGCDLERVPDAAAARHSWPTAPLILLDQKGVAECVAAAIPTRDAIVVVTTDPEPPELWKQAMQIGAERVITLPGAEPWLISALADALEGPASHPGKVLAQRQLIPEGTGHLVGLGVAADIAQQRLVIDLAKLAFAKAA